MGTNRMAREIWPRSQRGITLIELLIALFMTAIIGGALYQGLLNQSRSFIQEDQVAEAMQHCREATDQILRELRMAGYSLAYRDKNHLEVTINDKGIGVGTATVINGTAVTTNNDANRATTDSLVIRRGDGIPWPIKGYMMNYHGHHEWCKVHLDDKYPLREGDPDYVLLMNGDLTEFVSCYVMGRGLDTEDWIGKKIFWLQHYGTQIASDTDGDPSGDPTGKLFDYGADSTVVKFKEIAFYIDTSTGIPTLMKAINGYPSQIVARNIEDLQIAYQDSAGTWYRGGSGTTQSDPPLVNNIRNVRINVLARASTASPRNNYSHEALEDGNRHPTTGADGFIRRSLTTQVRARNFGVDIGSD